MSGNKKCLVKLDETVKQTVRLGNDLKLEVAGKGNAKVRMNGVIHVISDVYYVPELKNNLLRIGQLQEKGLTVMFKGGTDTCRIYHEEKGLILESKMSTNRMYKLIGEIIQEKDKVDSTCFHTSSEDLTHLWHCRFGHLSNKGLNVLQRKEMVKGLPKLSKDRKVCDDCMKGKQHRDPIPKKSQWRAKTRLELIHADVCGPISPASNSNKRYIICLIDDFSIKTRVYFMNEKSEAFYSFQKF